ncbi:MAG: FIST C-terminal domain-containing protein [Candidatus Omnitrophota bacterium]
MIGIGASNNPQSDEAGREAAQMANNMLSPKDSPGWGLAFCGGRHNPQSLFQSMRACLGGVEIVGGAAAGTITHYGIGYSGCECDVALFPASMPKPAVVAASGLEKGEWKAGRELGAQIGEIANEGDTIFLFYDSLQSSPPPVLNVGSRLLDGIYAELPDKSLTLAGAGMIGDIHLSGSFVFDGRQSAKGEAVAMVLPSVLKSRIGIMHGCLPLSSFLEITKIDGATLYEFNGRPALDVIQDMFGHQRLDVNSLPLFLTLGEKHGDPYADYDESSYVNRLILSADPQDGSLTLFEADFHKGARVQIMTRDNQTMLESVQKRSRELIASLDGKNPVLAFYIDCAGRTRAFSGADKEEAKILQETLGPEIPLLGFYSGVEIAPLLGRSRPLDWTGVLTLLTLEETL